MAAVSDSFGRIGLSGGRLRFLIHRSEVDKIVATYRDTIQKRLAAKNVCLVPVIAAVDR